MKIRAMLPVLVCLGCLAGNAVASPILVSDRFGLLHSVDSVTGDVTTIGGMRVAGGSSNVAMTDIALDSAGNLFGVGLSIRSLFSINPSTAEIAAIGPTGTDLIGLGFDSGGTLYGTSSLAGSGLYTVDTATGAGTFVGPIKEGAVNFHDLQDIAFDSNGVLYGVGDKGGIVPFLITIDPATGQATEIGATGGFNPNLGLGIAFDSDDNLFLANRPGVLFSVDTATAGLTFIDVTGVEAYGATSNPFVTQGPGAPEPATLGLFALGLALTVGARRRRGTD